LTYPLGRIEDAIYDDDLVGLWSYVGEDIRAKYHHYKNNQNIKGEKYILMQEGEYRKDVLNSPGHDVYVTEIAGEKYINARLDKPEDEYYIAVKYKINNDKTVLTFCGANLEKIKSLIINGSIEGRINERGDFVLISSETEVLQRVLIENKELNIFDTCRKLKRVTEQN